MVWKIYEYDPKPILENLSTPMLALFGGLDRIVPPERNVRTMAAALKRAGNKDYKIRVFPGVGHDFQDATTGGRKDYLLRKGYAPEFLNTITRWVLKHVDVPQ
jgi:pimeloyl-ACP methyl ester carboxylesterase